MVMKRMTLFIIIFILFSCKEKQPNFFDTCLSYQLDSPDMVWDMPSELNEISGISLINNQSIAAINDEKGILYIYSLRDKIIEIRLLFGKDADYEDVAVSGKSVFVLRSDGSLFEVQNLDPRPKTIKYDTFLNYKDNVEGLHYDTAANSLLLACKGNSKKKKDRLIYEFDLVKKELKTEAKFIISDKEINQKSRINKHFAPSGLAVHPISQNIYVISSIGKMMVELNPNGKMLFLYDLDYPHFQKPEGICFDKAGNLFISNEAKYNKANIVKFNYQL
jgi:uncharacterized protein YjiK